MDTLLSGIPKQIFQVESDGRHGIVAALTASQHIRHIREEDGGHLVVLRSRCR